MTVFITGCSRGLGLEFTRQYLKRGERVFASARRPSDALLGLKKDYPDMVELVTLDVTDPQSISQARARAPKLDLLINNAGIYSGSSLPQPLGSLTMDDGLAVMGANALAPILMAQAFRDLLPGGKIVSISSLYGSISANKGSLPYHYGASKAALNHYTRSLAAEVATERIIAIVMSPGWVRTDMGGPGATLSPEESVAGMIKVIDRLTPEQSGEFLNWNGASLPW